MADNAIRIVRSRPPSDEYILRLLRPYTREWFKETFGKFLPPQKYAIPRIMRKKNVLIFSPTGTGKTLAAFLGIIDRLFYMSEKGELEDKVYAIYISPLRALSNDIRKNLMVPLAGIKNYADKLGYELGELRIFVRHGDTTSYERSKMLRKPPHILITTPESLANMLIAPKFRYNLYDVEWVIVDEIHELSDNKRGAHLSLSLERLNYHSGGFTRIGLSATQAPIEEIAKWLVGFNDDGTPRPCDIVQILGIKKLDLKVLCPHEDLREREKVSNEMYQLIKRLVRRKRTVLIFTNTRSGAEAVAYKLKKIFGPRWENKIGVHHSSLGREVRLEVEDNLKTGKMKIVVTSTSLELGIDIGHVDLVIQIGSPKSVIKALQRVGRAGHAIHRVSKGVFIAMDEDDLIELATLVDLALKGRLDRITIPKNSLDILAQHLVAMSIEQKWNIKEAFRLVKRSYNYKDLSWDEFKALMDYLAGKYADLEYQKIYRKLWYDEKEGVFGRKRQARLIYYMNQGAIPDEADFKVLLRKKRRSLVVGQVSEPFAERLIKGDVFVLAGGKYKVRQITGDKIYVEEAIEENPTVPSWVGEQLPRSFDLSLAIGRKLRTVERIIKRHGEIELDELRDIFKVGEVELQNIKRYLELQFALFRELPTDKKILVETWKDEYDRIHVVFISMYGRRVCDALSRFFAFVASKLYHTNVGIGITDNGFDLVFPKWVEPDPEEIVEAALKEDFVSALKQAVRNTELFINRFRHVANRAFMILKRYKGYEISIKKQRIRASTLVRLLPDDFPIIKETYREILEDYFDTPNAKRIFEDIKQGKIKIVYRIAHKENNILSPIAQNIVLQALSDVLTMKDREEWIINMYKKLIAERQSTSE